jgi:hypothetical protein
MFDTHVLEQARCTSCSMVTHARRSSSFLHIVLATALCAAHAARKACGKRVAWQLSRLRGAACATAGGLQAL